MLDYLVDYWRHYPERRTEGDSSARIERSRHDDNKGRGGGCDDFRQIWDSRNNRDWFLDEHSIYIGLWSFWRSHLCGRSLYHGIKANAAPINLSEQPNVNRP